MVTISSEKLVRRTRKGRILQWFYVDDDVAGIGHRAKVAKGLVRGC